MKGQSFPRRLTFAFNGLRMAFIRERSFRVQVLCAIGVAAVLIATGAPPSWWALGAMAVGVVLVTELLNSALEALIDHLHPEIHPEIRVVKDIAAGAVLIASAVAIAVAVAFAVAVARQ